MTSRRGSALLLALLSMLIVCLRLRYLGEPLEEDVTSRMVYVVKHLQGFDYYSDLFAYGPPGGYWFNEVFVRLLGANDFSVFVAGASYALLTLVGIHLLARQWAGELAGAVAAICWTLLSFGIATQANQPNSEVYVSAVMVWGFLALQRPAVAGRVDWAGIAAGLLFFLGTAVKHHMLFMPLLAMLVHARGGFAGSPATGGAGRSRWYVALATGLGCWLLLLAHYALGGRLQLLLAGLVGHSLDYGGWEGGLLLNLVLGLLPERLLPATQRPYLPLYLALAALLALGLWRRREPRLLILLGWSLGSWLAVSLPGRGFPHYYQLWYPVLALGSGLALAQLVQVLPAASQRVGAVGGLAAALTLLGVQLAEPALYDATQAPAYKYGQAKGEQFADARRVGLYLATRPQSETVGELGASGLFFWAGRTPGAPFIDSLYGAQGQFPQRYHEAMLPALLTHPPHWMVVRRRFLRPGDPDPRRQLWLALRAKTAYRERADLSGPAQVVFERVDAAGTIGAE